MTTACLPYGAQGFTAWALLLGWLPLAPPLAYLHCGKYLLLLQLMLYKVLYKVFKLDKSCSTIHYALQKFGQITNHV